MKVVNSAVARGRNWPMRAVLVKKPLSPFAQTSGHCVTILGRGVERVNAGTIKQRKTLSRLSSIWIPFVTRDRFFHMSDSATDTALAPEVTISSLQRAIQLLRALAESGPSRVSDLARTLCFTQATTHRLLQQLSEGGLVHQLSQDKRYALGLGLATLAARAAEQAGAEGGLRAICRPALVRLGAALGETVFLMVRSGFDAVCLDRWEGPWPIRTFTGDIGGRVPLGMGQGAMCILAHLPAEECEEVLRYNVPRVVGMGVVDGVYLRAEINRTRELGYSSTHTGVLDGMAGVGVPVFDAAGRVAAAFSVGTLAARLSGDRLPVVVGLLQKEAQALAPQINPFDRSLRRPAEALRMAESTLS